VPSAEKGKKIKFESNLMKIPPEISNGCWSVVCRFCSSPENRATANGVMPAAKQGSL
jgi:radical SAM superfamily enzyme YgiQ (UPF0313 family)